MGGYDLYGRYYPNINDAINAETAQCAAIDADIAMREVEKMKKGLEHPNRLDDSFRELWEYVNMLQDRIISLEERLNNQNK